MRVKLSPVVWNHHAVHQFPEGTKENTEIEVLSEDSIRIDSEEFFFDPEHVQWPEIFKQTEGRILHAFRNESGELYVTVRKFYVPTGQNPPEWDTGDYHTVKPGDIL